MMRFLCCILLLLGGGVAHGQGLQPPLNPTPGIPNAALSGNGVPSLVYTCDSSTPNVLYIQRDSTNGRLWLCHQYPDGTWAWEHFISPIATATTSVIGAGSITSFGCVSTTVTIQGATPGVNSAEAAPLNNPGSPLLFVQAYPSATNTITVNVCNLSLNLLSSMPGTAYKVLMF